MFKVVFVAGLIVHLVGPAARADELPPLAKKPSYEVSPGIYKLLSENEYFRVILATWKPGESDDWHSHSSDLANYRLTDCHLIAQIDGGRTQEQSRKKGEVGFNPAITHKVKNAGNSDCVLLIVERR